MINMNAYYSDKISNFLCESKNSIYGKIHSNCSTSEVTNQQENAWQQEIDILKEELSSFTDGRILFEYTIPRMGKRVDAVILYNNIVFLLEFKCGDNEYKTSTYEQVYDYALDLRNFQKESSDKLIVCMMIPTEAPFVANVINNRNDIIEPLKCNKSNIGKTIKEISNKYTRESFNYEQWERSEYLPTPTIVEAAQALYRGHNVHEITRSDAGAKNLTITSNKINDIIEYSKKNKRKSICFVTGVPGAGKTLVGLNLAIERSNAMEGEHAVFLSGNFPLVTVLQEALARDKVIQEKGRGNYINKKDALRETSAFIQIIHKYRDSFVGNNHIPPERVVIFDEAQRAWAKEAIASFMSRKKGVYNFNYSEPEFLISTVDRVEDWAVIVCLVGGGQEINTGEAGLPEWFDSLRRSFKNWDVYITPQLDDTEYRRNVEWRTMIADLNIVESAELHLGTSVRSFRTPYVSSFVKELLDVNIEKAKQDYNLISDSYPIFVTRDLKKAKEWVKNQSYGTTRYGLLASSGAIRLKPSGIFVKNEISVANWFLNDKRDVRSSYYLEDVVSEFDIQGLELDYTIVAWDGDLRFNGIEWTYNNFVGDSWHAINKEENKLYLKNAYRVLLTRARQGMIIYIPQGDINDLTRKPEYYNKTYNYLVSLGIKEL